MTQAEQVSLDRLADQMDRGFRELRDLMEVRRLEEVRVQEQLDRRVQKVERIAWLAGMVGTIGLAFAVILANHFLGGAR